MDRNYIPPESFAFDPETIRVARSLLRENVSGMFTHAASPPRRHNLADYRVIQHMFHRWATTRAPGIRYDEIYQDWMSFLWVVTLISDALFTTVLRPGYQGALVGRGPFANDFTILRVPEGGPSWMNYLRGPDRVTFSRITNLVYTGTFGDLTRAVSS